MVMARESFSILASYGVRKTIFTSNARAEEDDLISSKSFSLSVYIQ